MREAVVAVFASEALADRAEEALETANIPRTAIRRYHQEDIAQTSVPPTTTPPAETERHRGFWSWLTGTESTVGSEWRDPAYEERYDRLYADRIAAGNVIIAVDADQMNVERVTEILAAQNPISLEDQPVEGVVADTQAGQTIQSATAATSAATGTTNLSMPPTGEERIPLAEEQIEVGKRRVEHPVKIRRYVIERPVEKGVTLTDERVEIERRPASGQPEAGAFEERVVEVHTSHEEPVVNREARVVEEAVVRREQTQRTETVHETARKEEVEVERDPRAPRPKTPRP